VAITFTNLGASANPDINELNDLSSYPNSSWTPPTSGLIVLFVASRAVTGTTNVPTVSGNSLTWTQIATVQRGSAHTMTLFGANASGSATGATTIDFAGQNQSFCRASFFLAEGVDLTGGVAAAFVQSPTNQGDGVTSGSVTLSAAAAGDNRPIAAFYHAANEVTTPRTDWDEMDDLAGSFTNTAIETQSRDDAFETTASASWATSTSVNWLGIAAELKATVAGGDPEGSLLGGKIIRGGLLLHGVLGR
jgi:hypothetical protein